jgi:molybdopterin-guanine dinucleotide biosynthesis protein A
VTSADAPGEDGATGGRAVAAVVLCGGAAQRFGSDKTRALAQGRPLLDHVLARLPAQWPVRCVGEPRPTLREVAWNREEPPGGGPAAAIAAALPHVERPVVVVVGGDMPFAGSVVRQLVSQLAQTAPDVDAVVARDGDGRLQPLLAAYRRDALATALGGDVEGMPLMRVLDRLRLHVVPVDALATVDVDTPRDLDRVRHRLEP